MGYQLYHYSADSLNRLKQRTAIVQILFPLILIIYLLARTNPRVIIGEVLGIIILLLLFYEGLFWIGFKIMVGKVAQNQLALDEEALSRYSGESMEKVYFKDILRVIVHEAPLGKISYITVKSLHKPALHLQGFERMEEIAEKIRGHLPSAGSLQRKQDLVDWSSPGVLVGLTLVFLVLIMLVQSSGVGNQSILTFIYGVMGLTFLIGQPLSRSQGKRFHLYEQITGALLVIYALWLLISQG